MPRLTSFAPPVAHLVGPGQLKVVNARLLFSVPGQSPLKLDPAALKMLCCYGSVSFSDRALEVLFRHDVQVSLLSATGGKCRGRLSGRHDESIVLRMGQHRAMNDPSRKLQIARQIVIAKLQSQQDAARHYQRHGAALAGATQRQLEQSLAAAATAESVDRLRGVEGAATACWFRLYGQLIKLPWTFTSRVRRPPRDPVNALLSVGYTWLQERTLAKIQACGLEAGLGALHEFRPGRPSLSCDVMEPFRVPGVDRWVLGICNQTFTHPDQFVVEKGRVRLPSGRFAEFLANWEQYWVSAGVERELDKAVSRLCVQFRESD